MKRRCLTNKSVASHLDLKLPENLLGFGGKASLLVGHHCCHHHHCHWEQGHHHGRNHQHHEIELCLSVTARGQIVATTCPPLLIFTSSSSSSSSSPPSSSPLSSHPPPPLSSSPYQYIRPWQPTGTPSTGETQRGKFTPGHFLTS